MLMNLTCKEFLKELASDSPAPGGGSVSALAGSLGGALAGMVAQLTLGKEKYAQREADMREALEKARGLQKKLQEKVDEDTEAFNGVMAAFRMPKGTEAEKEKRQEAIQSAMRHAATVPLGVAEACLEVMQLCRLMVANGNPNALSDGGVGALMAEAGVMGALFNVEINLGSIKDEGFVAVMRGKARELEMKAATLREEVIRDVKAKLQG